MLSIMKSSKETERRVFSFPTSQILLDGRKSSYYDVIHSRSFPECNAALLAVLNRLDMRKIEILIENIPTITQTHKEFYNHMLSARHARILKETYDALKDGNNE